MLSCSSKNTGEEDRGCLHCIRRYSDAPSENVVWTVFLPSRCCDTELETPQHIGIVMLSHMFHDVTLFEKVRL